MGVPYALAWVWGFAWRGGLVRSLAWGVMGLALPCDVTCFLFRWGLGLAWVVPWLVQRFGLVSHSAVSIRGVLGFGFAGRCWFWFGFWGYPQFRWGYFNSGCLGGVFPCCLCGFSGFATYGANLK